MRYLHRQRISNKKFTYVHYLKNYEKLFFNITIKKLIFVILNQS